MKRNLQVICLLISVFGCNVSHNKPTLYQHTKVLIGPEFEQFDTTIMYVSSKHERETGKQYLKSKQADTVFQKNNYNETLWIYDSKGRLVKDIIVFFNAKIYSEEFMDDSSRISKEFYSNGYIKSKAVFHWLGFKIGFDYKFNEKGKLTDAIDNDMIKDMYII